jgi:uncharacterized protein YwgA
LPSRWIVYALSALEGTGNRIGRTHIQTFLYLAENWSLVPRAHKFELYRYGPYSFDLDSELQALRSVRVLNVTPDPEGYGASYALSDGYESAKGEVQLDQQAESKLRELADWLGPLGVKELEAATT